MTSIQHILLATDFGPASQRALVTAAEIAEAMRAKVSIAHVLDPPDSHVSIEALREAIRGSLDGAVDAVRTHHVDCSGTIRLGRPWVEIVRAAQEARADLVVVGSHGRRGLAHALLGSVAEKVTRRSSVPVLTVHGFWFEDRVAAGRELSKQVAVLRALKPAVIAISRGGIVVAAEICRVLGTPLDILSTRTLEQHGRVFGALCEDGTLRLDPEVTGLAKLSEEREAIVANTRAVINEEVRQLRAAPCLGELSGRTVVLVTDALMDTWSALAADAAVRTLGAERTIFATPLVRDGLTDTLTKDRTDVVALHTLPPGFEPSAAYRHFREPSARCLIDAVSSGMMTVRDAPRSNEPSPWRASCP
ncbi:universal stress protein [Pendulispora brunnea]|uniref:Universal stress protein n=1 Tax=Pendulispora brunnea TaxID=2905690 RepID=A0ABZ2JZ61_9BACT